MMWSPGISGPLIHIGSLILDPGSIGFVTHRRVTSGISCFCTTSDECSPSTPPSVVTPVCLFGLEVLFCEEAEKVKNSGLLVMTRTLCKGRWPALTSSTKTLHI